MIVKLRDVGNSKTLTVPKSIMTISNRYKVKNVNQDIVFSPVTKHVNIFSTPEWKNYDYQRDMQTDLELQELKPVGKEIIE